MAESTLVHSHIFAQIVCCFLGCAGCVYVQAPFLLPSY